MSVQPILWRITWPSLRTSLLVETPTMAVCGAIGLPTSDPTELKEGSIKTGRCSSLPTIACTGPNIAFVEVLLPESATPIHPSTGASTTKNTPILERDRKSTRLNSSHQIISYAVFCLKKKNKKTKSLNKMTTAP